MLTYLFDPWLTLWCTRFYTKGWVMCKIQTTVFCLEGASNLEMQSSSPGGQRQCMGDVSWPQGAGV